jgi:hypothetical protein
METLPVETLPVAESVTALTNEIVSEIVESDEKTKSDRLAEGVSILTQLRDGGVRKNSLGFLLLKREITTWVDKGSLWEGSIPFQEYGREAIVWLPSHGKKAATLYFKVVKE